MQPLLHVVLTVFCIAPATALAEVMDKEPTLSEVWVLAAIAWVIAFAACRSNAWFSLATAPLPLLYVSSFVSEIADRHVGPAIMAAAGISYVVSCALAFVLVAAAHALGIILWRRNRLIGHPKSNPSATDRVLN
jgi:hypothetical protein